ncbi:MAG: F0F1 ATP synthase subunit B [Chloroflexota bacterium]|jgi:F-type H+-transporting ATPase subunit b
MEALGINPGYLLMQLLGISVLVILLGHFLYQPILDVLEERKRRIAKGLEDARQASIARDNADAEAKKILEAARSEAAKMRQDAMAQAEETRKGILAQAETEAKAVAAHARTDAEEERNRILSELRGQVAAIAVAAANKLVGETIDEKRQHELITDFFAKVPQQVGQLSGGKAVVTSALPLDDNEKKQLEQALSVENVEYRVDPKILGGLIVRVGDQVVDDSVAGRMSALSESLR